MGTKPMLVHRLIPQDGGGLKIEYIEKEVETKVIECVDPNRKMYLDLKRNYSRLKKGEEVRPQYTSYDKRAIQDIMDNASKEELNDDTN